MNSTLPISRKPRRSCRMAAPEGGESVWAACAELISDVAATTKARRQVSTTWRKKQPLLNMRLIILGKDSGLSVSAAAGREEPAVARDCISSWSLATGYFLTVKSAEYSVSSHLILRVPPPAG